MKSAAEGLYVFHKDRADEVASQVHASADEGLDRGDRGLVSHRN